MALARRRTKRREKKLKQQMSYWLKSKLMRRISIVLVLTLLFNPIALELASLNRAIVTPVAQAAVADRDGLGTESFWNFVSGDLGAGWQYSINTFTGNLIIQSELASISGRGVNLSEEIIYNSLSNQSGTLGAGWKLESDQFVQENADGSVTFKDDDATNHIFTKDPDGTYKTPDGVYLTLTKVDATTFTIKDKSNSTFKFQNGLLTSIADEKGNISSFSYDGSNRLSSMTDPSGRMLTYAYDTNGRLSSITDPANRTISFGYGANGKLN